MNQIKRLYEKETKETLWSFGTKGVAAVLFILLSAFLARVLGAERWGSWSFLLSILTIVYLLSYLGLNNAARAFTAQHSGMPTLGAVLRDSLLLRIAISAVFTALFFVFHEQIADLVKRPDLAGLMGASAPLIFLMGFSEYLKQVFTGVHRLKYHFIMNVIEFGGKLLLCFYLLRLAPSIANVLLSFWLAVGLSVLAGFYYWYRYVRASAADPAASESPSGSFLAPLFAYSLPLFLISIGFLILTEIDTLMLGLLSTDLEVGQFAVAKQLANKLPQVALALSMGTMPGFARLDDANRERMWKKFVGILRLNSVVFLPGGLLLVILAPWLIPLVFGSEYVPAVLPLQILTVWIVMTSYNMFLNAMLDYQGRARRRAINFVLTIALTVVLNLFLIPRYGAVGAAFSTTVSFAPYVVLNWFEVKGLFKGDQ